MKRSAKIQFSGSQPNCYATISWPLSRTSSSVNVIKIETSSKKVHFVSIIGSGGQSGAKSSEDFLRIHSRFGTSLALEEGEQVTVEELSNEPTVIQRANVFCVSTDDWEILESNAEIVTNGLLNQLRVVYPGLQFPFWVTKSMSINLKIENISPATQFGILVAHQSEIIVPSLSTKSSVGPMTLRNYLRFRIHLVTIPDHLLNPFPTSSLLFKNIFHAFILKSALTLTSDTLHPDPSEEGGFHASLLLTEIGKEEFTIITVKVFLIEYCNLSSDLLTYFPVTNPSCVYLHPELIRRRSEVLQVKAYLWMKPEDENLEVDKVSVGESPLSPFAPLGNCQLNGIHDFRVFKGITDECRRFVEGSLSLGLITHGFVGVQNGSLLIEGKEGSGKSWLAIEIAKGLEGHPHYVNWELINCAKWRGKKAETIEKELKTILELISLKNPSILILDDFDVLVPTGKSEQENIQEEFHHFKLCETFVDCLLNHKGEQLTLIFTAVSKSGLNSYWNSKPGFHFFQKTVNIPPPNQEERLRIFSKWLNCYLKKSEQSKTIEKKSSNNKELISLKISQQTDDNKIRSSFSSSTSITKGEEKCLKGIHDLYATPQLIQNVARKWAIYLNSGQKCTSEDSTTMFHTFVQEELRFYDPTHSTQQQQKGSAENWHSIGGLHLVKNELVKILEWPIRYAKLFRNAPIRLPSGILLYGFPGTGKTLIGLSISSLVNANFIHIKGPELLSKYIGASEQAVQDVFKRARNSSPCIIFFDEFDSLVPRRGHDSTGVTDRVVNQFLSEMDGIEGGLGKGVYLIGATSRPDLIDPAVLRPGRLDKHLFFDLPTKEERLEILKGLGGKVNLVIDYWDEVVTGTEGLSGADIHSLITTAQLAAVQRFIDKLDSNEASSTSQIINYSQHSQQFPRHVNQEITSADVPVTKEDLLSVLSTFKPSLHGEELTNFKYIYDNFSGNSLNKIESGSDGRVKKRLEPPKRATLA